MVSYIHKCIVWCSPQMQSTYNIDIYQCIGGKEGTNMYLSLNPLQKCFNKQSKLFGLVFWYCCTLYHLLFWLLLILLFEEIPNTYLGCIGSSTETQIFSIWTGDRRISEPSTVPQPSRFSNSKTHPPRQNIINHLIFGLLIIASYVFGNPQFVPFLPYSWKWKMAVFER